MKKRSIAIYMRLSEEDRITGEQESNSIFTQRLMLKSYIYGHEEFKGCQILEFSDDGYSGTNMDRPGMQDLLLKVKQGEIGCILVKDMSRFSRDYIELGTYLNQIFPFTGVRFISINDNYDSKEYEGDVIGLDTAFKTLLYDLYSKDLSVKVKSSMKCKLGKGEYAVGNVPFGYEKSKEEKSGIVVKEKEAAIVKEIFSLALKGYSTSQIARKLIKEDVPTIMQIRNKKSRRVKDSYTWRAETIRHILNNRFYLGELEYGKTARQRVGSRKGSSVPRKEWQRISDHHEALVSQEVFDKVSSFKADRSTIRMRGKYALTGKVYCGGCGYAMSYRPDTEHSGNGYFYCRMHHVHQIQDCCNYFKAAHLEGLILRSLYEEIKRQGCYARQQETARQFQKERAGALREQLKAFREEYQRLQSEKEVLYERYAERKADAEEYRQSADFFTAQMEQMKKRIEDKEREYALEETELRSMEQGMGQIGRFSSFTTLTQEVADTFVKRVVLYKDKRVEIEWKYGLTFMSHKGFGT